MTAWWTRWLRPRAAIVEANTPYDFLDHLAAHATNLGLDVREETVAIAGDKESAYRSSEGGTRWLVLVIPPARWGDFPKWRSLRVKQDGSTVHVAYSMADPGLLRWVAPAITLVLAPALPGLKFVLLPAFCASLMVAVAMTLSTLLNLKRGPEQTVVSFLNDALRAGRATERPVRIAEASLATSERDDAPEEHESTASNRALR